MKSRGTAAAFMTPGRWAVLALLALVLIVLMLNLYYQWIQSDFSKERRAAERLAMAQAGLTTVEQADKFVWDEAVWVVEGNNEAGEHLYAWVTSGGVETTAAAESFPRNGVKAAVLRDAPGAKLIRIRPGLLDGKKVWEAYYSLDDGSNHHYYAFYGFDSGEPVATYKLPARTAGG